MDLTYSQACEHIIRLAHRLYNGLSTLRHFNHQPLCETYANYSSFPPFKDSNTQSATLAFNVLHADGSYVDCLDVLYHANQKRMPIQTSRLPIVFSHADQRTPIRAATVTTTLYLTSASLEVDMFLEFLLEAFIERSEKEVVVSQVDLAGRSHEIGRALVTMPSRSLPRAVKKQPVENIELSFRSRALRRSMEIADSRACSMRDLYLAEARGMC